MAKELARKFRLKVDDAVKELQEAEGITKRDALRRLNQQRAGKAQGKAEALAVDEFTEFAKRAADQQRRFNPLAPRMTPQQAAEQGRAMQEHLKELGLTPQAQDEVGEIFNKRGAGKVVPLLPADNGGGFKSVPPTPAGDGGFRSVAPSAPAQPSSAQQAMVPASLLADQAQAMGAMLGATGTTANGVTALQGQFRYLATLANQIKRQVDACQQRQPSLLSIRTQT